MHGPVILITDLLFPRCTTAGTGMGASSQFSFNCFAKNEIKREYVWNVGSFVLVLEETEFQFLIIKLHCIFIGPMFYEL